MCSIVSGFRRANISNAALHCDSTHQLLFLSASSLSLMASWSSCEIPIKTCNGPQHFHLRRGHCAVPMTTVQLCRMSPLNYRSRMPGIGTIKGGRRYAAHHYPSLVYCGDDPGSKAVAAELIRDVGFDPIDVGPLRIARYTEPFALLVAELAYEGERGPELAYRFEWFRK